jgi:hypothetical protein
VRRKTCAAAQAGSDPVQYWASATCAGASRLVESLWSVVSSLNPIPRPLSASLQNNQISQIGGIWLHRSYGLAVYPVLGSNKHTSRRKPDALTLSRRQHCRKVTGFGLCPLYCTIAWGMCQFSSYPPTQIFGPWASAFEANRGPLHPAATSPAGRGTLVRLSCLAWLAGAAHLRRAPHIDPPAQTWYDLHQKRCPTPDS